MALHKKIDNKRKCDTWGNVLGVKLPFIIDEQHNAVTGGKLRPKIIVLSHNVLEDMFYTRVCFGGL